MNTKNCNNQKGMASIMFAIFIAVVISLLAIGFAVLVRNDQRQTLDKKLSNQAQYAGQTVLETIGGDVAILLLVPSSL